MTAFDSDLDLDRDRGGGVESTSVDVLVVGGGPCGLAAAYEAARRGLSVELVESAVDLGGMAASFSVAGQRVDLGSHRLHPAASPRVLTLLTELLGSDLQVRPRNGRLRLRDRWIRFPLRPIDMARRMPPSFASAALADAATGPFRRAQDGSYSEAVRAGLGPAALADFHGPMAAKLWGLPPERLSGELARKRISQRSPAQIVAKIMSTPRNQGATFLYPRLGYGQIVERLAEAAAGGGARLRTGCSVRSLTADSDSCTAILSSGDAVAAERVLWTAPVQALIAASDGDPAAMPSAPMRGLVLVYLAVDQPRYTPFDAHYIPTPEVPFSRFSEPKNYRDGPDPADRTVLCFELPSTVGDGVWRANDQDLAGLVTDGLDRLGLPAVRVLETAVKRLPSVYPLLTVDDPVRHAADPSPSEVVPGVTVLGRQGLSVADNLHHVVDMALSAIDCIGPGGGWSNAAWADHRRRFAEFVVED